MVFSNVNVYLQPDKGKCSQYDSKLFAIFIMWQVCLPAIKLQFGASDKKPHEFYESFKRNCNDFYGGFSTSL